MGKKKRTAPKKIAQKKANSSATNSVKKEKSSGFRLSSLVRKGVIVLGIGIGLGVLGIVTLFLLVLCGVFGELPTTEDLASIEHNQASVIMSADSQFLGSYFLENRTNAPIESVPSHFIDALIATEDARFYEHHGIDYRAWFRVAIKTILLQDRSAGGGSTITQQLAKNLFPRKRYSVFTIPVNKFREFIIARRLEKTYPKKRILELYLNTVSFGENTYGIRVAAQRFFNSEPSLLRTEESAVLVGMLKATSAYNPRENSEQALARRNVVFYQMKEYGYLTPEAYDSLSELPLELEYHKITHHEGPAPYFREHLRKFMKKWCETHDAKNGEPYNLYTDGLKIYTTIDYDMQVFAEEAVAKHMASLQKLFDTHWKNRQPWDRKRVILTHALRNNPRYKEMKQKEMPDSAIEKSFNDTIQFSVFDWDGDRDTVMAIMDSLKYYLKVLHCGFVAMESSTGKIKAWVGGINHKHFQYDHVLSRRQAGSVFKPIVYATALENGVLPCDTFPNDSIVYEDYEDWTPSNADGKYGGWYSLKGALAKSVNTVAVQLIMKSGIRPVIRNAKNMGISSPIPTEPSIALGTPSISLMELVRAYSVFSNGGYKVDPYFVTRIEDKNGVVLDTFTHSKSRVRSLDKKTIYLMNEMLQNVVNRGTAASIRTRYRVTGDIAGKTGTTQDQSDGWFLGYTPTLVAGAWVGADQPAVHFRSLQMGQGSSTALPIWAMFYKKLKNSSSYNAYTRQRFKVPRDTLLQLLDCEDFYEKVDTLDTLFSDTLPSGVQVKKSFMGKFFNLFSGKKKKEAIVDTADTMENGIDEIADTKPEKEKKDKKK